jgi:hypothetical protein
MSSKIFTQTADALFSIFLAFLSLTDRISFFKLSNAKNILDIEVVPGPTIGTINGKPRCSTSICTYALAVAHLISKLKFG